MCLGPCRVQRLGPQGAAAGGLRGAAQHGPEEGAAQAARLRTHPRRYASHASLPATLGHESTRKASSRSHWVELTGALGLVAGERAHRCLTVPCSPLRLRDHDRRLHHLHQRLHLHHQLPAHQPPHRLRPAQPLQLLRAEAGGRGSPGGGGRRAG